MLNFTLHNYIKIFLEICFIPREYIVPIESMFQKNILLLVTGKNGVETTLVFN